MHNCLEILLAMLMNIRRNQFYEPASTSEILSLEDKNRSGEAYSNTYHLKTGSIIFDTSHKIGVNIFPVTTAGSAGRAKMPFTGQSSYTVFHSKTVLE